MKKFSNVVFPIAPFHTPAFGNFSYMYGCTVGTSRFCKYKSNFRRFSRRFKNITKPLKSIHKENDVIVFFKMLTITP